jgi:hypothetical protein
MPSFDARCAVDKHRLRISQPPATDNVSEYKYVVVQAPHISQRRLQQGKVLIHLEYGFESQFIILTHRMLTACVWVRAPVSTLPGTNGMPRIRPTALALHLYLKLRALLMAAILNITYHDVLARGRGIDIQGDGAEEVIARWCEDPGTPLKMVMVMRDNLYDRNNKRKECTSNRNSIHN